MHRLLFSLLLLAVLTAHAATILVDGTGNRTMRESVRSQIDAIPDAAPRAAALIEWEYSTEIHCEHPLVLRPG